MDPIADYVLREASVLDESGSFVEPVDVHVRGGRVAAVAATAGGARLCGVEHEYGRIAPGYVFDAIALDEDPGDLSELAVTGVLESGVPAVAHPRLHAAQGAPA